MIINSGASQCAGSCDLSFPANTQITLDQRNWVGLFVQRGLVIRNTFGLVLLMAVCVAIAMLGPGAFSVDAYLFGHRKVIIPERKESK